jgi:broad specificity phosphatase PhoE
MKGMRVEDGENFDDLLTRADAALTLLEKRPEQSIVVVTHGYFLRAIVARILIGDFFSPEAFGNILRTSSTENTGLTVIRHCRAFEEESMWRLWIFNDHAHLADD